MPPLRLYLDTARHLKPSQVYYRIMTRLGRRRSLSWGYRPSIQAPFPISFPEPLRQLDYDPVFIARFDADAICDDAVELLHASRYSDWKTIWHDTSNPDLWRYNLHYCEYLLPLAYAHERSRGGRYLEKAKAIVESWIEGNPRGLGGDGWQPYTIALRLVSWLEWASLEGDAIRGDEPFMARFSASVAEQYVHLATHLEKDILANHYLEDLKTIVIVSLALGDETTFSRALPLLEQQVKEQILPDGMHFELSPMYHKIVFEDLMRVAWALRRHGRGSRAINDALPRMANCLYSLERGTNTTPLFNDSGNNVAKDGASLLACARGVFGIVPQYQPSLPDAGYYFLERDVDGHHVKVIFDAGQPGPGYAMGHVHCDALSFECYVDGEPYIANSGTFEYAAGERRRHDRSTAAHNTVMVNGHEQSECWGQFRVARRAKTELTSFDGGSIVARCTNYVGETVERRLELGEDGDITIHDRALGGVTTLSDRLYRCDRQANFALRVEAGITHQAVANRACDFGFAETCTLQAFDSSGDSIHFTITLF